MYGLRISGYMIGFSVILITLFIADIAIIFDVPVLRQILGSIITFVLPGLLILFVLKLDRLGTAVKIVLTIGLSAAFLMFFGWILSQVSLQLGYTRPLATNTLLISLTIVLLGLAIGAYFRNRDAFSTWPFRFELNTPSKLYLLLPATFPLISILGTHYLNTSENNVILLAFLFLVPVSVILIGLLSNRISEDTYPLTLIIISAALLCMSGLRTEHVIGHDVHTEYYIFHTTLANSHWSMLEIGARSLDSCLSISVLPAMVQSLLQLSGEEYLFKGVYALICTFTPLAIYTISKKYVEERYAFLAAFYFISQLSFLSAPGSPRTNMAIFFFALCIMALFHNEIAGTKQKSLILIFIAATIVSHYSTTYIFWFLLLATCLLCLILRKYCPSRAITLTGIAFFTVLAFLWYGMVTEAPFGHAVRFFLETVEGMGSFFVEEARSQEVGLVLATGMAGESPIRWAHWAFTWLSFALIFAGVIGTLIKHRVMIRTPRYEGSFLPSLRSGFETEYFLMSMVASALLGVMVAIPYVSVGYDIFRVYSQMAVVLSVFLVVGGIILARYNNVISHVIIWMVLIPCFLFATWAAYEVFGVHENYLLSAEAPSSSYELVYDQEIPSALWLKEYSPENSLIYTTDRYGRCRLVSQGKIAPPRINDSSFVERGKAVGFLYLNHNNVVNHQLVIGRQFYDMSQFSDIISAKNKIYANGGSEIYK